MKKIITVFLAVLCLAHFPFAQDYEWSFTIGGGPNETVCRGAITDPQGNLLLAGSIYTGTTGDFEAICPGAVLISPVANFDGFLAKYDASGCLLWLNQIEGLSFVSADKVDSDPFGNTVMNGLFSDSADFDPGPGTHYVKAIPYPQWDHYVSSYDAQGNLRWVNKIQNRGSFLRGLVADTEGKIVIAGNFLDTLKLDPTSPAGNLIGTAGDKSLFVGKYDSLGNWLWGIKMQGWDFGQERTIYGLDTDSGNNIFITGSFADSLDMDPGPGVTMLRSAGLSDVFIAKYSPTGQLLWAKNLGASQRQGAYDLVIDASDNLCLTGMTEGAFDMDPGPAVAMTTAFGFTDIFLVKYDNNGDYLWGFSVGGADKEEPISINAASNGDIYITGEFDLSPISPFDADPGPGVALVKPLNASFNWFYFLLAYDANGAYRWSYSVAEDGNEFGCLTACSAGSVYLAGTMAKYDHDLDTLTPTVNAVYNDAFVIKIHETCGAFSSTATATSNYNGYAVSCPGASDGAALAAPVNGTGPFNYLWSNGDTTALTTGLSEGSISVTVTDTFGCSTVSSILLNPPTHMSGTFSTTPDTGSCSGTATIIPTGGAGGYTYVWDLAAGFQTAATATDLCPGTYCVTITDMNGCILDTCTSDVLLGLSPGQSSNFAESQVRVYPNPNAGSFSIDIDQTAFATEMGITVMDIQGRKIGYWTLVAGENHIQTELPQGLYLLEISLEESKIVRKLLVK